MTLKNCSCGDTPVSEHNQTVDDPLLSGWNIHCLGCGIFIYAPTEEECGQFWNDAMEAAERRVNHERPAARP
jgi:hypothetical protein